jgi:hypothetical protein
MFFVVSLLALVLALLSAATFSLLGKKVYPNL